MIYLYKKTPMTDFDEDQIWDTIMESAKTKIDYPAFSALFPFNPDNFLSSIIYGFAVGRPATVIADKIAAQVFMTGNEVDKETLLSFVEGGEMALAQQIALTVQALQMLNAGEEPELIYETVVKAL